jgi:hypothetical protein
LVVVLHARQPIAVDVGVVFPRDEFDVRVVTAGERDNVVRPQTPCDAPIDDVPRESWADWLRTLAHDTGQRADVVTNDEYCLEDCAALRILMGSEPRHPASIKRYRDKILMKATLAAAGIDVPSYLSLADAGDGARTAVGRILDEVGLPAVVKPRAEANNRGVEVVTTRSRLKELVAEHLGSADWEVESYVNGRMLHVNAIVDEGRIIPLVVGEYTDSLLALGNGMPVGSITLPKSDPAVGIGHAENERVIAALGSDGRFAVHTELVLTEDGSSVVLEAAARAPGALVSEIAAIHAGVQLEETNFRLQVGVAAPEPQPTGPHAGWMWFPVPASIPKSAALAQLRSDYQLRALPAGSFPAAALLAWSSDAEALRTDVFGLQQSCGRAA